MGLKAGRTTGRKTRRTAPVLLVAFAALALLFTACSNGGDGEDTYNASSPASSQASENSACETGTEATSASCEAAGPGTTVAADRCSSSPPTPLEGGAIEGTFGPWCENAIATAYDTALIPAGAETELSIQETDMDTTLVMQVQGFAADTDYMAVLHTDACGASAADAGPEFVRENSGDNVSSGLIADFTTDADGSAEASVTVQWTLPDNGSGKSLLVQTPDGSSAGCVTIP